MGKNRSRATVEQESAQLLNVRNVFARFNYDTTPSSLPVGGWQIRPIKSPEGRHGRKKRVALTVGDFVLGRRNKVAQLGCRTLCRVVGMPSTTPLSGETTESRLTTLSVVYYLCWTSFARWIVKRLPDFELGFCISMLNHLLNWVLDMDLNNRSNEINIGK